eukprot:1149181-Pelagomonas_calceolata.AAC.1
MPVLWTRGLMDILSVAGTVEQAEQPNYLAEGRIPLQPNFKVDLWYVYYNKSRVASWWRGVKPLLSQCVSFSSYDIGRVSSAYIVFLSFPTNAQKDHPSGHTMMNLLGKLCL